MILRGTHERGTPESGYADRVYADRGKHSGIIGLRFEPNAAAYYRLDVPLLSVGGTVIAWNSMTPEALESAHTLVISRMGLDVTKPVSMIREIFDMLRNSGTRSGVPRRILVDWDDDLSSVPAHNQTTSQKATERAIEGLRRADGIIASNRMLATRLKRYNRSVSVVENYVRSEDWPDLHGTVRRQENAENIWIVLAGSHTHHEDWKIAGKALAEILPGNPAVRLRVLGYLPDYLEKLCSDFVPWGTLASYQAALYGGDIGLAPLPDTAFNRCKSPIKAYEYALAGMAVIASPTQYGPVLSEGRGIVCVTPNDWGRALRLYINDAARRKADAARLRSYVKAQCDISSVDLSSVYHAGVM